jgi:hypothetical protein
VRPHSRASYSLLTLGRARIFDRGRAIGLAAAKATCIPVNRNNGDLARMSRTVSRAARRAHVRTEHSELENGIAEAKKRLEDASKSKSSAAQQLKDLQAEKKSLGRAPCNSLASGDAAAIPRVLSTSSQGGSDSDGKCQYLKVVQY